MKSLVSFYMANDHFRFKQFLINQGKAAFKVGTDGVLLGAWADISGFRRILDIGTGTGLIALMLAQRCNAFITAIEPDSESYSQAVENIINSRWADRLKVENTDFQSFFNSSPETFDLIVTNPPFFTNSLKNPDIRKSNTRHNEILSTNNILTGVSKLLSAEGKLRLIMPYAEGSLFIAEASSFELYCNNILKVKTQPSGPIRRLLMEFGRDRLQLTEKFLTIESGGRHVYSDEYVELTKDFYLYF
jgi:tRNA1Val (adenine37-N6)-methyltransferase